jgi:hypothetical protein
LFRSEFVEVQDNYAGILFEGILVAAAFEFAGRCESRKSLLPFLIRFEFLFLKTFPDVSNRSAVFASFDVGENIGEGFILSNGGEVLEYGEVHKKFRLRKADVGFRRIDVGISFSRIIQRPPGRKLVNNLLWRLLFVTIKRFVKAVHLAADLFAILLLRRVELLLAKTLLQCFLRNISISAWV